jgi:predicted dinucleotide-binding enzyme
VTRQPAGTKIGVRWSCGDDQGQATVTRLLDRFGFDAVDAGR